MKLKLAGLSLLVLTMFATAVAQDQPNMVAARADLNIAKRELMVAEHNKGGHRVKAMEYINSAIVQINKGIAYARRHNHAETFTPAPDQPHMEAALGFLRSARSDLERATADKGGYRGNALRLVDQAIDEVKAGIEAGR